MPRPADDPEAAPLPPAAPSAFVVAPIRAHPGGVSTMDDHRSPIAPRTIASSLPRLTRRQALGGLGGGALALLAAGSGLGGAPRAAAAGERLVNPCSRVLLPGEAGLADFGLDFTLSGAPTIFFAAGDTPGWSDDLKGSVAQFAFGYSATLTQPSGSGGARRAVQVCVHQGFPSSGDADVAWTSLTTALSGRGNQAGDADVATLDLVEVVVVEGESILATVAGSQLDAIVLASRSGGDLVTVAIADFEGNHPSVDEAVSLAEAEGAKLRASREIERTDLRSAYQTQWTPGFQLGSAAGAPFFAWPTFMDNAPVEVAGESAAQLDFRRQVNAAVQHQSHIEGPFWESAPLFDTHGLFYSAESNFFASSSAVKGHHGETRQRLDGSLRDATIVEIHLGRTERRYGYETPTDYGTLSAITLHRIVQDGDYPLSLSVHIVAVPYRADAPALDLNVVIERLDPILKEMREGLEGCLVQPESAPLTVSVKQMF
jgi:hypothetical protein